MLRRRLDAEYGNDSRQWALGLVGTLAAVPPAAAASSMVGVKAAALVLLAGGATFFAWRSADRDEADPPRGAPVLEAASNATVEEEAADVEAETRDEAADGPGPLVWKILPGNHGVPPNGTKLRVLWDKSGRPPMQGVKAWTEGEVVIAEGVSESSGNAFAVAPNGNMAWIRWNRRARRPKGWVADTTFYPQRQVRVKITERNGEPLVGAPVHLLQNSTPRGAVRTDSTGEVLFERLFGKSVRGHPVPG